MTQPVTTKHEQVSALLGTEVPLAERQAILAIVGELEAQLPELRRQVRDLTAELHQANYQVALAALPDQRDAELADLRSAVRELSERLETSASADAALFLAREQLIAANAGWASDLEQMRLVHEGWVQRLTRDAHERANDLSWCPDFDDFMEKHGLDRRQFEYRVTRTYSQTETVTETCTVWAMDEDAAQDVATEEGDWSDQDYGDSEPNNDHAFEVVRVND